MDVRDMNLYKKKMHNIDIGKKLKLFSKIIFMFLSSIETKIKKHKFKKFIVDRGINTLKHVFIYTFLYTRNIDLAMFLCKKAFIYYIEFIIQIKQDIHAFLCLTSKDATIFVFKKTIFNINKTFHNENILGAKSDKKVKKIISCVEILTNVFTLNDAYLKSRKINSLIQKIIVLNNEESDVFLKYINHIKPHSQDIDHYYFMVYFFLKKLNKKKMTPMSLVNKFSNPHFKSNIIDLKPTKFIRWLFE